MRARRGLGGALAVLAVALAACGGGDGGDRAASPARATPAVPVRPHPVDANAWVLAGRADPVTARSLCVGRVVSVVPDARRAASYVVCDTSGRAGGR